MGVDREGAMKKTKMSAGKWVAILASALGVEFGLCAVVPNGLSIYFLLVPLFLLTFVALLVAFVMWLIEISNPRRDQ
jgi:hypothetical protein